MGSIDISQKIDINFSEKKKRVEFLLRKRKVGF